MSKEQHESPPSADPTWKSWHQLEAESGVRRALKELQRDDLSPKTRKEWEEDLDMYRRIIAGKYLLKYRHPSCHNPWPLLEASQHTVLSELPGIADDSEAWITGSIAFAERVREEDGPFLTPSQRETLELWIAKYRKALEEKFPTES